jgi:hypothetical protein
MLFSKSGRSGFQDLSHRERCRRRLVENEKEKGPACLRARRSKGRGVHRGSGHPLLYLFQNQPIAARRGSPHADQGRSSPCCSARSSSRLHCSPALTGHRHRPFAAVPPGPFPEDVGMTRLSSSAHVRAALASRSALFRGAGLPKPAFLPVSWKTLRVNHH